jgi:hypothetical protein
MLLLGWAIRSVRRKMECLDFDIPLVPESSYTWSMVVTIPFAIDAQTLLDDHRKIFDNVCK